MNHDEGGMKIGFIGQGWIGRNYADHYEDRGFEVVRYSLDAQYRDNIDKITSCDMVFIAVPTPTTPRGFDGQHVKACVNLAKPGATVVIKSTVPPGFTSKLQRSAGTGVVVLHAPEFLREAHARHDVDNPLRNIIGVAESTPEHSRAALRLLEISPHAKYSRITTSTDAEMIKYAHNALGYATVVFANLMHDLAASHQASWPVIREAIVNNDWFPSRYLDPVHNGGRGAGGDCFIKDFATFALMYQELRPDDEEGVALIHAFIAKNNRLLRDSGKDLDILEAVHGSDRTIEA